MCFSAFGYRYSGAITELIQYVGWLLVQCYNWTYRRAVSLGQTLSTDFHRVQAEAVYPLLELRLGNRTEKEVLCYHYRRTQEAWFIRQRKSHCLKFLKETQKSTEN